MSNVSIEQVVSVTAATSGLLVDGDNRQYPNEPHGAPHLRLEEELELKDMKYEKLHVRPEAFLFPADLRRTSDETRRVMNSERIRK